MKRYLKWWEKILFMSALLVCFGLIAVGVYSAMHFIQNGTDAGTLLIVIGIALVVLTVFFVNRRGV